MNPLICPARRRPASGGRRRLASLSKKPASIPADEAGDSTEPKIADRGLTTNRADYSRAIATHFTKSRIVS